MRGARFRGTGPLVLWIHASGNYERGLFLAGATMDSASSIHPSTTSSVVPMCSAISLRAEDASWFSMATINCSWR